MNSPCCSCTLTRVRTLRQREAELMADIVSYAWRTSRCAAPPHGLQPDTMAPITSDCDAMRCPSIKWP